jgi:trimeric autotransporter adhesin
MKLRIGYVIVGLLSFVLPMAAQTAGSSPAAAQVPPLVNFSGVLADANGKPLSGVVGVTFSLYQEQQGGSPLWLETQNVQAGKTGNYTVALGSTRSQGLPANVFATGEARWLGVQVQGQAEQPRILLVSVPYALKALDAETIGGKPASSFLLAPAGRSSASAGNTPPGTITGSGNKNHVARFTSATTIGNSDIFEATTGNVGIGTTAPSTRLDVSGTGGFRDTVTLFPTGTHPTLAVQGTAFAVSHAGLVTFVAGQKFPGTGTITGVIAGTDLTGGGSSGMVTLNLDTAKVPQLNTANTFTANQTVNGAVTATSFSGNGASLTNVNAAKLGGLAASAFAQLGANNTFTGSEQLFNNTVIVGPITSFTEGELAAGSPSAGIPAAGAAGFTAASGSGGSGGDGIVSFGGSGDFNSINGNSGGRGIFAEGGGGDNGGVGIFALGGGGIQADGSGGFFEGGSNVFTGDGIDAVAGGVFAGNFSGDLNVTGTIFAGTKDFKIDHPLDPANKYLVHTSVESSEMMNIYTGNVITDTQGYASVRLPDWFEVLNTDFRYQLTVIGVFAQAIVAREIQNGEFAIRTSVPNVKVSWQVMGVRQDSYAKAHPLVVEQEKETRLRGFYIHPELYGAPAEKQIEWARHPQLMRQAKERKERQHPTVKGATLAHSLQPSR